MSYCKFQNTLGDLRDCYDAMSADGLSESEIIARKKLIELCALIASEYGEDEA